MNIFLKNCQKKKKQHNVIKSYKFKKAIIVAGLNRENRESICIITLNTICKKKKKKQQILFEIEINGGRVLDCRRDGRGFEPHQRHLPCS